MFEFQCQVEVFIVLVGGKIAVLFVGTVFADEYIVFVDIPFLSAIVGPSFEFPAIYQVSGLFVLFGKLFDFYITE